AYSAMGEYTRVVPVIVFHGTSDYTVNVTNGHQVIAQCAQTKDRASDDGVDNDNITDTPGSTVPGTVPGGRSYTQYIYYDSAANGSVMEKYIVEGMGHAWSGGSPAGSYTDPQGPEASQLMWQFFVSHPKGGVPLTPTPALPTATPAETATPTLAPSPTPGSTPTVTPTPTPAGETQLFFPSLAAEDGYVGALLVDGYSATNHKVGDKGMYNQDTFRVILSFDSSALPEDATITGATLRLYRYSLQGSVSELSLDIRRGYFGTSSALARSDYSASASAYDVATLAVPVADNQYTEISLPLDALSSINTTGHTQFRLKATAPVNFASDVLTLYGGEDGAYAPSLWVTYDNQSN
ncbi:MAG: PHB depolymerase family esterase, partial [Ardenticatenaceae bacterium]